MWPFKKKKPAKQFTMQEVKAKCREVYNAHGREVLKANLSEFCYGSEVRLRSVAEKDYPALMAQLEKELEFKP